MRLADNTCADAYSKNMMRVRICKSDIWVLRIWQITASACTPLRRTTTKLAPDHQDNHQATIDRHRATTGLSLDHYQATPDHHRT
jgi:hypothetical protein